MNILLHSLSSFLGIVTVNIVAADKDGSPSKSPTTMSSHQEKIGMNQGHITE
jgi:hypothetical protein